jgi:hypothetical protein
MDSRVGPAGCYNPPVLPGKLVNGLFQFILDCRLSLLPLVTAVALAVVFDYEGYFS